MGKYSFLVLLLHNLILFSSTSKAKNLLSKIYILCMNFLLMLFFGITTMIIQFIIGEFFFFFIVNKYIFLSII